MSTIQPEFTMSQYASKDDMIGAMRQHIAELESRVQELGQMARDVNSRRVVELEAQLASIGGVSPPEGMAGWISVDERLPEAYVEVLLVLDGKHVTTGEYMHNLSCFTWEPHDDELDDSKVTHWMKLPEPPNGTN